MRCLRGRRGGPGRALGRPAEIGSHIGVPYKNSCRVSWDLTINVCLGIMKSCAFIRDKKSVEIWAGFRAPWGICQQEEKKQNTPFAKKNHRNRKKHFSYSEKACFELHFELNIKGKFWFLVCESWFENWSTARTVISLQRTLQGCLLRNHCSRGWAIFKPRFPHEKSKFPFDV